VQSGRKNQLACEKNIWKKHFENNILFYIFIILLKSILFSYFQNSILAVFTYFAHHCYLQQWLVAICAEIMDTLFKKPKRPCPFCGVLQSKLRRHIMLKHKSESEVMATQTLPKQEQDRAFNSFRKKGIFLANKKAIGKSANIVMRERKKAKRDNEDIVMCGYCNGFYAKAFFHRHKARCTAAEAGMPSVSVPLSIATQSSQQDEFSQAVLSKLHQDAVGKLCQTDEFIISVGKHLYGKARRKQAKQPDVRRSCMRDMRRLGSLALEFKEVASKNEVNLSSEDMLNRKNFPFLETAITSLSKRPSPDLSDSLKAGTKLALGYILKTAAKVMKVNYLIEDREDKAKDVDNFAALLSLKWSALFGDAEYQVVTDRQERLRKPARLPSEESIAKVRNYTLQSINELTSQAYLFWSAAEFNQLRNLLVSRLTLFNSRRGGEPSRLLMKEWIDAENNVWMPDSVTDDIDDPAEKVLMGKFKIAYQAGKGSQHLVSLLIPNDCLEGMKIITSEEVRANAGVLASNPFVFAYTQQSMDHMSGWHATHGVCQRAGVEPFTATDMRHRVSTYYASLEVPECDRKYFYMHMGHSENMNRNVYQCPMAVAAITKVGKHLSHIDTCGM